MTPLLPPGALAVAAVSILALPRRRPTPPDAPVVAAALARLRRTVIVCAIGLPLLGGLSLISALDPALAGAARALFVAVGVAVVALGALATAKGARRLTALRRALDDGSRVVALRTRPWGVEVALADGARLPLFVHPADSARAVDELARVAPHAARQERRGRDQ